MIEREIENLDLLYVKALKADTIAEIEMIELSLNPIVEKKPSKLLFVPVLLGAILGVVGTGIGIFFALVLIGGLVASLSIDNVMLIILVLAVLSLPFVVIQGDLY